MVTSEIFSTVKAVKLHLMYNQLKMHDQYAIKLLSKYAGGAQRPISDTAAVSSFKYAKQTAIETYITHTACFPGQPR